jgi:SAM-dependent methyltransferase
MSTSTGSFQFFDDYEQKVYGLQPELYGEIRSILERELRLFADRTKRLPKVMDVGSAGLIPFDPELTESTTILDLFPKPPNVTLKPKVRWDVGDILEPSPPDDGNWDIVVMSSVLHHLADRQNHAVANVRRAFENISARLRPGGVLLIFESVCSPPLAIAQDLLYPVYSRVLVKLLRFTYVRMLSLTELARALLAAGLPHDELPFRQPPYIAQMRWRVPSKYYPLTVRCLKSTKSGSSGTP